MDLYPIKGFDQYFMDALGQIRSTKKGKLYQILPWYPYRNKEYIQFYILGKGRTRRTKKQVHKLVQWDKLIRIENGKIIQKGL